MARAASARCGESCWVQMWQGLLGSDVAKAASAIVAKAASANLFACALQHSSNPYGEDEMWGPGARCRGEPVGWLTSALGGELESASGATDSTGGTYMDIFATCGGLEQAAK